MMILFAGTTGTPSANRARDMRPISGVHPARKITRKQPCRKAEEFS